MRRHRKARGWSQGELGVKLGGISHAAVSDIERGKTKIDIDRLSEIAAVFSIEINDLLNDVCPTCMRPY
ncbi:MAG TPA: helix-turn-helix transcriptional regulator [Chloroflexota bacterium]|nr:helix-turn-helix transcriptional regulator [Chloroflexota bacterium]